jgi:hypothetical protein
LEDRGTTGTTGTAGNEREHGEWHGATNACTHRTV